MLYCSSTDRPTLSIYIIIYRVVQFPNFYFCTVQCKKENMPENSVQAEAGKILLTEHL